MRHLWTLIASVVIAPLAWLLLAFGQDRSTQAFRNAESTGAFDSADAVRPAVCLLAVGLLLGLMVSLRVSPLGAGLAGAAYSVSYLALLFNPEQVLDFFPDSVSLAGREADPTTPLRTGTALAIGVLMLVGVASAGRWRRWPAGEKPDVPETGEVLDPTPRNDRPLGGEGLDLEPAAARTGDQDRAEYQDPAGCQDRAEYQDRDWYPDWAGYQDLTGYQDWAGDPTWPEDSTWAGEARRTAEPGGMHRAGAGGYEPSNERSGTSRRHSANAARNGLPRRDPATADPRRTR
nr:hypothetical protein [Micromonospora sp. DSM 115978]